MTDAFPDPSEPTDLLEFPPLPQQPGRSGDGGPRHGQRPPQQGPDSNGGRPAGDAGEQPDSGPIRVVPEAEATARIRIMLPTQPPTPSTALRPQHSWEDTHAADEPAVEAFARVAASPASPSTLPSQLAAMTLATMVIPLPPSVRPGSGLLTTTLPPDQAAQANAAQIGDAFRDTIEEIFGVDLETVDPAELGLPPRPAAASAAPDLESGYAAAYGAEDDDAYGGYDADVSGTYALPADPESGFRAEELAEQAFPPIPAAPPMPFPRPVPAEVFGGPYGVPTARAPFGGVPEPADPFGHQRGIADPQRHALALRYLGGIFHDSSGESSFLDPDEIDQGWIPSAFGAVPPDAPTEQIARITAELPTPGYAAPAPAVPDRSASAPTTVLPAITPTTVLPAVASADPVDPAHGRSGARRAARQAPYQGGDSAAAKPAQPGAQPRPAQPKPAQAKPQPTTPQPQTPQSKTPRPKSQHTKAHSAGQAKTGQGKRGKTLTLVGLVVAGFAMLYGIALLVAGGVLDGKIPAGVSVDGVNIGGMSQDAARNAIATQLGPISTRPVQLMVGQTPVTIDPAKSGLSLDVVQTVAAAEAEHTDPFSVIPALFGVHHAVDPVIAVDQSALTAALDKLAATYDSPLVEGEITFTNGQPVVTDPKEGRGFDVAAAVNAVKSGYLRITPIELPVNAQTPRATADGLQSALEQIARPAVSAPITIVTGSVSTTLTPTQIGNALTIEPNQSGTMVPILDGTMLRADLNPAALATERQGTNASFTVISGQPQLIAEKDGVGYSPQALASAVAGVLTSASPRSVTLQQGPLPPSFTTAQAQALGVQAVLGSATIAIPAATDRDVDTTHATSLIMGTIVQPGEVWSFNKTVGAPTKANGYTEPAGTSSTDGVDESGADDMVATAVFDAAFHSGMGDTVHHPNAAYFSRYPVGLDAAVVYPGTDLQWTNSGSHPVYVYASYANGSLTVALLGQSSYDQVSVSVSGQQSVVSPSASPHYGCPAEPASNGFQVVVTRVLTRGGAQVGTEQFHVSYQPFEGTTCGATSTQSPAVGAGSSGKNGSAGSTTASTSRSSGGGGGSGGGGTTPAPNSSSAAPTSSSGVLGGLLH
ncbi:VanW family protein [Actinospica sp. MGRD01-02]|uniref:VanW family protein n=1 Tax=Actinospica acidithermotolerans TaxID=2828514 RepID=A0A941IJS0_9ACTN|nr:VanW family protein [Actinospica acidithermotolerans]MBR7827383.1 VanW family protein [Actinospica acidithermotolerans]